MCLYPYLSSESLKFCQENRTWNVWARVGLKMWTGMKFRIAMPSISANPDIDDMVLRPPSPSPNFLLTPPSSCVIQSLCQIASKRQETHCLPWMSRNTHFIRTCEHWLCIAGGLPRLHCFQQPQSTKNGKRSCDFCSTVTQGLPEDLQRAAGYTCPCSWRKLGHLNFTPCIWHDRSEVIRES